MRQPALERDSSPDPYAGERRLSIGLDGRAYSPLTAYTSPSAVNPWSRGIALGLDDTATQSYLKAEEYANQRTLEISLSLTGLAATPFRLASGIERLWGAKLVTDRIDLAWSFYREAGFKEGKIADHIRGIDFNKPVEIISIPKGTEVIQYQIPGGPVGSYFAAPGTPGNQLGFYTSGRQATTFVATENIQVLRSTASSTIDDWSMKAYSWKIEAPGGGIQFFSTSKAWRPK